MKKFLILLFISLFLLSCDDKDQKSQDSENNDESTDEAVDETVDESVDENSDEEQNESSETDEDGIEYAAVIPGVGVGNVEIGMKYSQIKDLIGAPDSEMGFNRLVTTDYKTLSLELVFTSPDLALLKDDAVLIAMGAKSGGAFSGKVIPGMTRDEIEKVFTGEKEDTGDYVFYPEGFSVQYENNVSVLIGVFPPYKLSYSPPEMINCKTSKE